MAIKASLAGIGSFTTAGLRFSISAIVIIIWALLTERPLKLRPGQLKYLLILSLLFVIHLSLVYLGINKTYASRATLLTNIQPFFVLILAHIFTKTDRITMVKFFSMALGFAGVAVIFTDSNVIGPDIMTGDILIIISSFFWAVSATYIKRIIGQFRTFHIVLYPMLIASPFFFLEGYLWDNPMISYIDFEIAAALFYQTIIASTFGFIAWNHMLSKTDATKLHTFVFIMPISGVILSGLILNETITYKIIIALLLIGSGILFMNKKNKISSDYHL